MSSSPLCLEFKCPQGQHWHMWKSNLTRVLPNSLKGWVCATMSMWLAWQTLKNMCGPLEYTQPPCFYLPDMSVWVHETSKCMALKADRGTVLHEIGRPVCCPGSWCGRRSFLLNIGMTKKSWALARMNWSL